MEKKSLQGLRKITTVLLMATVLGYTGMSQTAEPAESQLTLISNVNIFDGENEKLLKNMHVLVKDNLIETISSEPKDGVIYKNTLR